MPAIRDPLEKMLGGRLRKIRQATGHTQMQLAAKLNLTFQQIQKYEQGKSKMSASKIIRICEALHTSPALFFEYEYHDLSPEELALLSYWPRIPAETREVILALCHQTASP